MHARVDDPRWPRLASAALVTVAGVVLASGAAIALAHLGDRFKVSHVSGAWMALAGLARDGQLYPDLFADGRFGGTRFMPLSILALAPGLALTGAPVLSAKLLSLVLTAAMLALAFRACRRAGASAPVALGLMAAILASGPGLEGLAAPHRGDVLPIVLQLAAVGLVGREDPGRGRLAGAAVLSAAAVLSKLTAVWAPAALLAWLALRSRRAAGAFGLAFVLVLVAGAAGFELLSEGRMSSNLLALSTGEGSTSLARFAGSPRRFLWSVARDCGALALTLPLAVVAALGAGGPRGLGPHFLGLPVALAALLASLADPGVATNHFLETQVLAAIGAAAVFGQAARAPGPLASILTVLLLFGAGLAYDTHLLDETRAAVVGAPRAQDDLALARSLVRPGERVLSEDPTVPVLLGERPVVLDPFMLLRLAQRRPDAYRALIARVRAREFDKVLLLEPLDGGSVDHFDTLHLGRPLVDAVGAAYALERSEAGYHVYVPRPPGAAP
jgi:hypothetical protein